MFNLINKKLLLIKLTLSIVGLGNRKDVVCKAIKRYSNVVRGICERLDGVKWIWSN